jgi:hypothetical protein
VWRLSPRSSGRHTQTEEEQFAFQNKVLVFPLFSCSFRFLVLKTVHLNLNSPDFWIPPSLERFRLTRSEGGPIIDLFWQPSRSLPMLKSYRMVEVQVMR